MSKTIIIIGAGLAGLSAALQAAENGCNVKLVSSLPSERAQSVMAEGGINAALNTKDENDSPEEHFTDTIKAACGLADPNAVWGMTQAAPELVHWLLKLGVKFNMSGYDDVDLRNFGGQKKKRTAFAQSDTGKQIMTAMIDAVRRLIQMDMMYNVACFLLLDYRGRLSNDFYEEHSSNDSFLGFIICFILFWVIYIWWNSKSDEKYAEAKEREKFEHECFRKYCKYKEYMNDSHNPMNIISSSDPEFQIYLEEQWKEYKTKKKNGKKGSC